MPRPEPYTPSTPVAPCPACGQSVLHAITADGTRLVLDLHAPTYLLRVDERHQGVPLADSSRSYVVHESVCRGQSAPATAHEPPATPQEIPHASV